MIQKQTYLNVRYIARVKEVLCSKILYVYKCRYAQAGEKIIRSIKTLRLKRKTY